MSNHWPDVIISDIEMPEMDGFEFLRYLNRNHPTPFIVFSNHTGSSAASSVEALAKGAVEIIPKPNFSNTASLEQTSADILNAVRAAANIELKAIPRVTEPAKSFSSRTEQLLRDLPPPPSKQVHEEDDIVPELERDTFSVVAIGSSTGGTTIIEKILTQLKPDSPGVVIVQHMPELFTKAFAEDGDEVRPGIALIAPGGKHMALVRKNLAGLAVRVYDADYVNRHKPSVDVLFNSVAEIVKKDALGIILTGMGKDGAKGLLAMKQAGAVTIGQNEEDCAVYGMPKAAHALGAVDQEMTSRQIAAALSHVKTRL